MRSTSLPRVLVGLIIALAAARPAAAQDTGTISGTVVDTTDQVLPGVTVTLVNERTAVARMAVTSAQGDFTFRAVVPDTYSIRLELAGFRPYEQRHNVLNASSTLSLGHLKMEIGTVSEVITVVSEGTVVETKNSDYSGLLTANQIAQIQSKGRDVVSLLKLLPGVHYENDVDAMGDSFGTTIPNIGGQRKHWNQVTVDGLNGNELSGTNRMNSSINLDAIAEVKVLLNTYKAEFGHSGGANIQVVSKSGSADYRGSAYYYGRRDAWNAMPWENARAGLAKPKYHIDTPGFNLGGPVKIPGLYDQGADKKLFFFYSFEGPQVQRPGQLRLYRMPTALERTGDFSQTFDANGRLIFIKDPLSTAACSATTGGAGCFPGNVIASNRLDPNALVLVDMLPLPNALGVSPNYNFTRQETSDNPRFNNLLRFDSRPSGNNAIWATARTFSSAQNGSEITAGPAKWGFFNGNYTSGDNGVNGGWNHITGGNSVNELGAGIRRATESFGTKSDSDWNRLRKADVGFTLSQFHPELNALGVIPAVTFGLATTGVDSPDFSFDNRIGSTAYDWLASARDNFTFTRGTHTVKAGGHLEFMVNNEARGGLWMGQYQFNNNSSNPLNTNFAFANAVLGVYSQYSETDRYGETHNRQWWTEWYAQDTWQIKPNLTIDYGLRFLFYSPYWRPDRQIANFDPARYDPKQAPRLYQPALINGTRVAFDPVTGQSLNAIYIGAYVPGSGSEANGMVLQTDSGVPKGFRKVLAPQPEPRLGFTWDVSRHGTTVVRGSAGLFHNARLGGGSSGNLRNPPFIHTPILFYNTLATTFAPGITLLNRPVTVEALQTDYKTPSSFNWSIGVRRELGWGTAAEVTYSGYAGRHMENYIDINGVPDGARFLDTNPAARDPSGSATAVLPPEFLRPYSGYQNIRVRGNSADADYHALQVQVNRRYTHGVQFGASYTLARARGVADEDPGNLSITLNRPLSFFYSELAQSDRHTLVFNYSWDLPRGSRLVNNAVGRLLLDGWQITGENDFVTGDWAPVILTTADNFDFTGGEGGTGSDLGGGLRIVRPVVVGDPNDFKGDPLTGLFDVTAFRRPSGRGDYGNAPRNAVRKPSVKNMNLAIFKNFAAGGRRAFQFRAEAFNVLNNVQFQDIDRTARFDAAGTQINPNFGSAIGISNPTRPPRIVQLSARFSF